MVGGCRLHSHSRTTGQHALSSGESEMSMSDFLKRSQTEAVQFEVLWDGASPDCPAH